MREELLASGAPESVVEDAVLVLSELLSNACRHARPLRGDASVTAAWSREPEGELRVSVTDGGGPTRPLPATPSITARGGRGLAIISALARDWGVHEEIHGLPDAGTDSDSASPNGTGPDGTGPDSAALDAGPDKDVTVWVVLSTHGRPADVPGPAVGIGGEAVRGTADGNGTANGSRPRGVNGTNGHGSGQGIAAPLPLGLDLASIEELR